MANGSNASRATRRSSGPTQVQQINNATAMVMRTHRLPPNNQANVQRWLTGRANRILQTGQAVTLPQALLMAINQYDPNQDPNIAVRQPWADMTTREVRALQTSMGQTGDEAGRLGISRQSKEYVGTSKSYNINAALESDMTDMTARGSSWDHFGLKMDNPNNPTMGVKQIIRKMDAGMKPLTKNLNLTRMDYSSRVLEKFGIQTDMKTLMSMSPEELNKTFYGKQAANHIKGYQSTLYSERNFGNDTFKARDVVIQFEVRKGTHAIATNNVKETEIIIGRGYDQMIKSASIEYVFGQPKLVLNVVISPNARSGYYDV